MEKLDLQTVIAVITATGGLGLAAMSLVDAFKAIPGGGVSRIGFRHIDQVIGLFDQVLARAAGPGWRTVILSHWINGRPRDEQIGVIRSLLRLGLNPETAAQLAVVGNADPEALAKVAAKLVAGEALDAKAPGEGGVTEPLYERDMNLLGRVEAAVEARLDAAFDLADRAYRNGSRVLAGVIAVILAVAAVQLIPDLAAMRNSFAVGVLVGLLAVPIAPIAKDLVSALTAAANAMKAARRV